MGGRREWREQQKVKKAKKQSIEQSQKDIENSKASLERDKKNDSQQGKLQVLDNILKSEGLVEVDGVRLTSNNLKEIAKKLTSSEYMMLKDSLKFLKRGGIIQLSSSLNKNIYSSVNENGKGKYHTLRLTVNRNHLNSLGSSYFLTKGSITKEGGINHLSKLLVSDYTKGINIKGARLSKRTNIINKRNATKTKAFKEAQEKAFRQQRKANSDKYQADIKAKRNKPVTDSDIDDLLSVIFRNKK